MGPPCDRSPAVEVGCRAGCVGGDGGARARATASVAPRRSVRRFARHAGRRPEHAALAAHRAAVLPSSFVLPTAPLATFVSLLKAAQDRQRVVLRADQRPERPSPRSAAAWIPQSRRHAAGCLIAWRVGCGCCGVIFRHDEGDAFADCRRQAGPSLGASRFASDMPFFFKLLGELASRPIVPSSARSSADFVPAYRLREGDRLPKTDRPRRCKFRGDARLLAVGATCRRRRGS